MKFMQWTRIAVVAMAGCAVDPGEDVVVEVGSVEQDVAAPPIDSLPAPADYDNDGCMDIGLKGSNGLWYIDYCANGFGSTSANGGRWDAVYAGYGDNTAIPVPGDYDGDGLTDLAVKDSTGLWSIDYGSNKFGMWDIQVGGYGFANAVPVPADYDGDGSTDLAIKDSTGLWAIDYSADGYHGWNYTQSGYGDATYVPVPADYDGDHKADLATKNNAGAWSIDYSRNGFGKTTCVPLRGCTTYLWDNTYSGYGDNTAVPVPADYNHDGYADLAVKNAGGVWYVDYYDPNVTPRFGGWDNYPGWQGRGGSWSIAVPGNYTKDGVATLDLAVKENNSGNWLIDNAANGFSSWDQTITSSNRPVAYPPGSPYILSTKLYDSRAVLATTNGTGRVQLTTGVEYTVVVSLAPNNGLYTADVQVNAALEMPNGLAPLNLKNTSGSPGGVAPVPGRSPARRFALTCTQPGSYRLGFEMRDADPPTGTGTVFNSDYGIIVQCLGSGYLNGRVTRRACFPAGRSCGVDKQMTSAAGGGRYVDNADGTGIGGATITIAGLAPITTDANGYWSANVTPNTPLRVKVTAPNLSEAEAINVIVPGGATGGLKLDMSLEETFTTLTARGMKYKNWYDYSHGRTLIHVVTMPTTTSSLRLERAPVIDAALLPLTTTTVPVLMNGGFFDVAQPGQCPGVTGHDEPVGYFYSVDNGGYAPSFVPTACPGRVPTWGGCVATNGSQISKPYDGTNTYSPMVFVQGTSFNQTVKIIHDTPGNFLFSSPAAWNNIYGYPMWDVSPRDNVSDVQYAMQAWPVLVRGGTVLAPDGCGGDAYFARTALGVGASGVSFVVADAEGVNGHGGASAAQMAAFMHDALNVTDAVNFDSGESTQLVLWSSLGARLVNTRSSENAGYDVDPFSEIMGLRAVGDYVRGGN